ncbi:anaerobic dehydrogenase, typicallyselenocysteine-containing [Mizugakiibacter sediminis]|uniref:Anaerobic dehydrogenase, typicallyselenocysteine-containing n=1 Tax=Mizugakiibacter sediminis TaxID=1475481 RepID=A0A0K8QL11_9GAMM|nr:anaerobic dehydrogenase, typicallyselenocysteine-containing [Mizugakiibacter sediminis]
MHLKDGRVRYIDGNPAHPVNRGAICAKGAAGPRQHDSPARLRKPLLRTGPRGAGEFREIEWSEALALAAKWLGDIRKRNPDELAFFTGRDQSQALTGWWAQQFGTVNYAAHGGFCSVNMAAAGMYTLGGSFWEFGEPDWEHTKYLLLWGVAEDHDSNPIKLGLGKLKARGAKIVAINPVRTGYAAIADEWVPIRPGTDGLLIGALLHELLRHDRIDLDYLVRYTNAHWLVIRAPGSADDGLFARDAEGHPLCAARDASLSPDAVGEEGGAREPVASALRWRLERADAVGIAPVIVGEYALPDGRTAVPAFQLLAQRFLAPEYAPQAVAERCGVPAATIRRLAQELAKVAFEQAISLPQHWTDAWGREHADMLGRPVAMHAMRGIGAHANGFHTCRMLHLLQMLLGAIDTPGSFRYQPPYPKAVPPANRPGRARRDDGALDANPLGYVHAPADLLVDADGRPRRIDKAFSWEHPLAAHGMLQTVIRNAWAGDPYRIDTLFLFMANMGWNSAMNTAETRRMLADRDPATGRYRIPHIIYVDAYGSETVDYADLVLPDTTYLERHDGMSLLDRPISDADGAADAIRVPVVAPDRDVRPFQDVLLELGARLRLPGMADADGAPVYRDYADYLQRHQRAPGVGLLAGWRGADGTAHGVGAPNPRQLEAYAAHDCHWRLPVPAAGRYYKMANRDYLEWARALGFVGSAAPIVLELYSETLQRFRLSAQGHGAVRPPARQRARVERYFDPLPFWYDDIEADGSSAERGGERGHAEWPPSALGAPSPARGGRDEKAYPLHAISQRPMFMYHAWGSHNVWLRQIAARNCLYLHPATAAEHGVADGDWVWLVSPQARIRVQARLHAGTAPGVLWTWNAIGKGKGAWRLAADAPESRDGFLLNHLIGELLPPRDGARYANADPVTGQAAWYDLRVRLERDAAPEVPGHRIERATGSAA